MPSPAGVQNGTKVVLAIEDPNNLGTYLTLEGEATHSVAYNRALIEITNKSSDQWREYLTGDEGTKALDATTEALASTDAAYTTLRAAWFSGAATKIRRVINGVTLDVTVMVESMSDPANLNEAVRTSFSLKSTGEFTEA